MLLNKNSTLYLFSYLAIIFSLLAIPLNISNVYVPNFFALILIAVISILYINYYSVREIKFLLYLFIFLLFSVIFTPGLNIFTEKIKGLLQILFSSSFFIIVINLTQRKGIDRINIIVKYSLFLVLTLALLEII